MAPWRGGDGRIGGAALFAEVRTEQVEARRALADSEARFRATFENAAVGVALVDTRDRFCAPTTASPGCRLFRRGARDRTSRTSHIQTILQTISRCSRRRSSAKPNELLHRETLCPQGWRHRLGKSHRRLRAKDRRRRRLFRLRRSGHYRPQACRGSPRRAQCTTRSRWKVARIGSFAYDHGTEKIAGVSGLGGHLWAARRHARNFTRRCARAGASGRSPGDGRARSPRGHQQRTRMHHGISDIS